MFEAMIDGDKVLFQLDGGFYYIQTPPGATVNQQLNAIPEGGRLLTKSDLERFDEAGIVEQEWSSVAND